MSVWSKMLSFLGSSSGSSLLGALGDVGTSLINVNAQKKENQKDRDFNAEQAEINRNFQSKEAEEAYERQVEFYETHQSPAAMVQQYKDAGLNPMLASGSVGGASSTPVASSPSGSAASSSSSSLPSVLGVAETVLNIKQALANIKKTEAEASKTTKETSWIDRYNSTDIKAKEAQIDEIKSNIELNAQQVNESIQRVQESIKKVSVMDSEIEVNGARVQLLGDESVLKQTENVVAQLNADKLRLLLPYVAAREEQEIALSAANRQLADARSDESRANAQRSLAQAEEALYNANQKMLACLVEQKLIDSDFYDNQIEKSKWDAKATKRSYKWQPVNDICSNVSKLAVGAGSVMMGVGNLSTGGLLGAATSTAASAPANLSFF